MKTKVSVFPGLAAGLAVATFFAGCEYPYPPPSAVRIIHTRPSLAAAPAEKPAPPGAQTEFEVKDTLSKTAAEVLKMYESGVGAEVLAAHVKHSPKPFQLAADQIIYFTDLGVPDSVTTAMIERDQALGYTAEETPPAKSPSAGKQPDPPAQTPSAIAQTIVVKEPAAVTTQVFYSALSPYGTWMHVGEYGWVWQPTAATVNVHWRPYYDRGHWMYTDAGWYWHSGYSWGWAPFHYGRWSLHSGHGWIWVPGNVWSPSWVSFRYTDNYCGWAPLPPRAHYSAAAGFTYHGSRVSIGFDFGLSHRHYTFVSRKHFGHHSHHRRRADRAKTQQVFNDSTVVNNYIVGDNNTIINKGISRDRIAGGNFGEIRKIALRDVAIANQAARTLRVANQNKVIPVYRPKVIDKKTGPTESQLARQRTRPTQKRILSRSKTIPTPSRSAAPSYRNKTLPPRSQATAPTYRKSSTRTYAPPQRTFRSQEANRSVPSRNRSISPPSRSVIPSYRNKISTPSYTRKPSQPVATPRASTLHSRNRAIPTPSRSIAPSYRNKTATPQYQAPRPSTSSRSASLPKTMARTPSRPITTPSYRPKSPTRTYAPPQRTSRSQEVNRSVPSRNRAAPPSRSRSVPSRNTSPSRARSIPQRAKSIPSR